MVLSRATPSIIHKAGPPPWLWWAGSAPRDDRERNKLLLLDSLCEPGTERREVTLSTRRPRLPDTSRADEVVGVEATEAEGGGLGNGALERGRELFEKEPGLNRPAVA
jgi:hypothetical protein